MKPFITVVMPIRNEARYIKSTLQQLLDQEYPADRYEILVADGMSDDGTRELVRDMARKYPHIRLLDNPKRRSSAGRNIGFTSGRGDYYLVVDGHCFIPDRQLFNNLAECFGKSGADCLGRPQPLDPPGLTRFQKTVAMVRGSWLGHGGDSLIYGTSEGFTSPVSNGAAYDRKVFEKIGYVDETFDAAEDVEFNYRIEQAGLTCYSSPKLTVKYFPRDSFTALFRQMVRYGEGRYRFARKHPRALTVNQLIPAAFVAWLLVMLLSLLLFAAIGNAVPLMLTSLPCLLYLLLLGTESIRTALQSGILYAMPVPALLFVIHFGLGWGFVKAMAKGMW